MYLKYFINVDDREDFESCGISLVTQINFQVRKDDVGDGLSG